MVARGPYSKGVAKRSEILDAALRIIAEHGYSRATVKELADAVGLSQNGLLHYFGSKDNLFTAIVEHRDQTDAREFGIGEGSGDFRSDIVSFVRHNEAVPGLIQLFARLSNEAAEPAHPSHEHFARRYERTRAGAVAAFEQSIAAGDVRGDLDPAVLAVLLTALNDGLQTQWMFDPSIDMGDHIAAFLDLLRPTTASP